MGSTSIIEPGVRNLLARYILQQCREYMRDPVHQKEFEEWYLRTYGHKWEDREKYRKNDPQTPDNISQNH